MANFGRFNRDDLGVAAQMTFGAILLIVLLAIMTQVQKPLSMPVYQTSMSEIPISRAETVKDHATLIDLALKRGQNDSRYITHHEYSLEKRQEFVDVVLWPSLNEITKEYPVERLRRNIGGILERRQRYELNIYTLLDASGWESNMIRGSLSDKGVTMTVYVPQMIDVYEMSASDEAFKDRLIIAILLEDHLLRHAHQNDFPSSDNFSCVWFATIEHVLIPMLQAGRLHDLYPGEDAYLALHAHQESDGDPWHPAWIEFSQYAAGQGKLAMVCQP
ncbi:MAG: hypothetical protein ABH846_02175 [Patescibacteria group bacterium]